MLCGFASINDLNNCKGKLGIYETHDEEVLVFQATQSELQSSFYALAISAGKVNSLFDDRSMLELVECFPQISNDIIQSVWNAQHTWGACFDVLNSLLASHNGSFILQNCGFFLSNSIWPALYPQGEMDRDRTTSKDSYSLDCGDWSIVDISQMKIDSGNDHKETTWELVSNEGLSDVTNLAVTCQPISYLQVLLKQSNSVLSTVHHDSVTTPKVQSEWKPATIVVNDKQMAYELKNRVYMHNSVRKDEDKDDDYEADAYFQSSEYLKGIVSTVRTRAVTMLKPASMDKKLARIAAKK